MGQKQSAELSRTVRTIAYGDRRSAGIWGDAPSSPGDARLGTRGRQSYLLLLPSRIPAKPPWAQHLRSPFFPKSSYLPVAASSGVANTTIPFFPKCSGGKTGHLVSK